MRLAAPLTCALVLMTASSTVSAASWQVSATLTNVQIDRASTNPVRDRQIIGIVVSVLDDNGAAVTGLKRNAFDVRAQTCQPNLAVAAENQCRLGKAATVVVMREMEVPGTYFVRTEDTYGNGADEVLSQGVVVLSVWAPGNPRANQPAVLKQRAVLTRAR